jgi:uncharacterized protein (DUF1015 family)
VNAGLPPLVAAFRGERYAAKARLAALLAPPYDVITREERTRYAGRDPHNIVHLILPEAPPGEDRYARAAATLAAWRAEGVLSRDAAAAVYVAAQDFALPSGERRARLGMFGSVRAEPFTTRRVRPHESTHSAPKADRLALLRATRTNLESIFLLAPDPDRALAQALVQAAAGVPEARAELEGVRVRLWVVAGEAAERLAALAGRAQLYIADGHHRYETAVAYAQDHPEADRVLSFVVSASDPGLTILPTHRIIFGAGRDPAKLVEAWREWFEVGRVAPCMDRIERLAELGRERTACVVAFPGAYDVTLVLKRDAPLERVPGLGKTPAVRALDVARVEALVVQYILAAATATPSLGYTADAHAAFDAVRHGGAAAAVLLNPTKVEQVLAVADAGDVMPPKSTYFAPKVPSGLVLRPVSFEP